MIANRLSPTILLLLHPEHYSGAPSGELTNTAFYLWTSLSF